MTKTSPKDVFLHLLSIATLYISVGAFLALVFALINNWFPDPLDIYYSPGPALRWSLSLLVVLFPTYVWSMGRIHQNLIENSVVKGLTIKKWLIYLTLFAAGAFILGDLIALINKFLGGELTTRFLLKVLTILIVSFLVFSYYKIETSDKAQKKSFTQKYVSWISTALVIVFVVIGFWTAGSPFKQRLIKFDEQRVNDLSVIQGRLIDYWQRKSVLPDVLNHLEDNISGFEVPRDPKSDEEYEYNKTGDLSFQLCATFDTVSVDELGLERFPGYKLGNWSHEAGNNCFDRTIDPELYKLNDSARPLPIF